VIKGQKLAGIMTFDILHDKVSQTLEKRTIHWLAIFLYSHIVSISQKDDEATASASFDLAVAYHKVAQVLFVEERKACLGEAIKCVRRSLSLMPGNPQYWSALGSLVFGEKPELAQHAYIKAIEYDSKVCSFGSYISGGRSG
jgi:superkiller protein 3